MQPLNIINDDGDNRKEKDDYCNDIMMMVMMFPIKVVVILRS